MNTPKLPPLPEIRYLGENGKDRRDIEGYTADDMQAYAIAATEPLLQRIAELEQNNRDSSDDVQMFRKHAMNEKAARMELERQLEEARNQALEESAVECDKRAHAGDAGALMAARAIRALKGAKE